jgi:CxxC motif-containing protein (DUF1111 family)
MAPPGGRLFGLALITLGVGLLAVATAPMLAGAQSGPTSRPIDPGVRGAPAGAGGPITGITGAQLAYFNEGLARFNEVDSVSGSISGEPGVGLGPRFNMNSCAGCHAQPNSGGSSPSTNPEVTVARLHGATNQIPFFITANGPVREVRFVRNPDGTPDGGVHDLFTIAGRSDTPSACTSTVLPQPNFAQQAANGNVIFRIPTPVFGTGLITAISDDTLYDNLTKDGFIKSQMGISGRLNREGNAGTVSRFGWKAQNKSLPIFAGEAYLVEQGVSNELFPQERGEPGDRGETGRVEPFQGCLTNPTPEDATNFTQGSPTQAMSDVEGFALFMSLTAPPQPVPFTASALNGQTLFNTVGCNLCHTPQLPTGTSNIAGLSGQNANLFSDMAVHNMGSGLSDGVSQGGAGPDEFRTAPLWGVGQRVFFLHDGRTRDLYQAIEAHASSGSEANRVINNFNNLGGSGEQDILNFLRSL